MAVPREEPTAVTETKAPIDPRIEETRRINELIEQALDALPPTESIPPATTRAARAEGRGAFPLPPRLDDVATTKTIPGRGGDIELRIFTPPEVTGAVLHIHGGGWTFGENWTQDAMLWDLAQRAKVAVASTSYRLAPEDPYPAGPDDCEDAALWFARNAKDEFGTERLLIGGESAGAHLSAVTLLRLRDRHGLEPFAGAILTFGCYDLSTTPSVRGWGERRLVLNTPVIDWFIDNFVPDMDREQRRDPDVSPLYASLEGMPPAIFCVGSLDPILDDTLFMEARWRAAGCETELHVYPEAPHGFLLFPGGFTPDATGAIASFAARAGTN